MKKIFKYLYQMLIVLIIIISVSWSSAAEIKTLEIGESAPDFNLPGIDNKNYSLKDFADNDILVIIFTCNHCPTAQSYEDRIIKLVNDYRDKSVAVICISPNDPQAIRLDELGYTDLGDSFGEMKIRAKYKGFNFPYLYDGENQITSRAYGPVATPHVFIFDKDRKLRYVGRIDNTEEGVKPNTIHDTRNALDELLAGKPVTVAKTKTFGCSIKWSDKRESVKSSYERMAKEEVTLEMIDEAGIKEMIGNDSEMLRLINVWATWCGPCVVEFPELVKIYRMYRRRGFEFIAVSADKLTKKDDVIKFLKKMEASNKNYLFSSDDKYALIEAVDKNWQGALPYTLLVKPGGNIIYSKGGQIDFLEMKRMIVGVLGREKDW